MQRAKLVSLVCPSPGYIYLADYDRLDKSTCSRTRREEHPSKRNSTRLYRDRHDRRYVQDPLL